MADYTREITTTDFQPGDRVEILQGKNKGKFGVFVDYDGDGKAIVRSIETGNTKPFPRSWLWLVTDPPDLNSVQDSNGGSDPKNDSVEPQPLRRASPPTVEVQPLQNGRASPPTVEVQPLQNGRASPPTVEVQPLHEAIAVLESLKSDLISEGILADCWIETYQRSGGSVCRLVHHRHTGKTPTYFPIKELEAHQKAIDRARILKAIDVVLRYYQGNPG